jgi:hypothetical protein
VAKLVRSTESLVCRKTWRTDDSDERAGVEWMNVLAGRQA